MNEDKITLTVGFLIGIAFSALILFFWNNTTVEESGCPSCLECDQEVQNAAYHELQLAFDNGYKDGLVVARSECSQEPTGNALIAFCTKRGYYPAQVCPKTQQSECGEPVISELCGFDSPDCLLWSQCDELTAPALEEKDSEILLLKEQLADYENKYCKTRPSVYDGQRIPRR